MGIYWKLAIIQVVAVIIHESGHILAAWACTVPVKGVGVGLLGVYVRFGHASGWKATAIALGGPLANVIVGWWTQLHFDVPIIAGLIIAVGIVQLLPLPHSDGMNAYKGWRSRTAARCCANRSPVVLVARTR